MKYEFITYDKLNEYLYELTNNKYKNKVTKQKDLAYSPCGFPIAHYFCAILRTQCRPYKDTTPLYIQGRE